MPPRHYDPDTSHRSDLLCFSHLRWDWVFQRPQHLMTRAARDRRVFFIEEPVHTEGTPHLLHEVVAPNVTVLRPMLPPNLEAAVAIQLQRTLLDAWMARDDICPQAVWYYTPMALPFSSHIVAPLCVYDCMDELRGFAGAPPALQLLERQLMAQSDVVFTGGYSLYEAKSELHANCHPMPSSVDARHFARARTIAEAEELSGLPRPRIGYCGVLDERLDLALIDGVAAARPDWQLVFVGPVCKIDPATLPQRPNVHYLGGRAYEELPRQMAGWQVGWMPFAINEATRFISPTKTPEYLAAGLHVVSTAIRDVVRTWGAEGHVHIATTIEQTVAAIDACLTDSDPARLARVDRTLGLNSWDATWQRMQDVMSTAAERAA